MIDLEALGKKGYSVPKAGTIQVVSHSLASSSTTGRRLVDSGCPQGGNMFHYFVSQGSSPKAGAEGL